MQYDTYHRNKNNYFVNIFSEVVPLFVLNVMLKLISHSLDVEKEIQSCWNIKNNESACQNE